MDKLFTSFVEAAIQAPSGENCQPWSFQFKDDQIRIYNLPNRDLSIYNFEQKGSYIAHGAAIENIVIAASNSGYGVEVQLFPDNSDADLVAIMSFTLDVSIKPDPLYSVIPQRQTNRKPYQQIALSEELKKQIYSNSIKTANDDVQIKFVSDQEQIKELSPSLTVNEQLIFSNPYIHKFFFEHVRWTEEQDNKEKNGFFVKALELNPMQVMAFRVFKNWPIIKFLGYFGFDKIAGKANIGSYIASGALAVITTKGNSAKDYILAGRATQRMWLTVTSLGLSMQPVTGTLYFMQNIFGKSMNKFTPKQIALIQHSYAKIKNVFNTGEDTIAMLFRIGKGDPPTARSSRFEAVDFIRH